MMNAAFNGANAGEPFVYGLHGCYRSMGDEAMLAWSYSYSNPS